MDFIRVNPSYVPGLHGSQGGPPEWFPLLHVKKMWAAYDGHATILLMNGDMIEARETPEEIAKQGEA